MPDLRTLPEALSIAAASDVGYVFVGNGGDLRRSYAEIERAALRVGRSLVESGLRRGDLVALVISDAEQFLTAFFGASIAGFVPASLYPPSSTSELPLYLEQVRGILRASRARAVVTTAALKTSFDVLAASCPELSVVLAREALDAPPIRPATRVALDDIAFVQFTSGSTSTPKGVALTHRSISANINAIVSTLEIRPDDVAVSWLPLFHDMGLVGMAIVSVCCARPAALLTPQMFAKRPVEWLRAITRHRGTMSFAPNFAYDLCVRRVKDRDLEGLDLSCWRIAGCGSEPIQARTLKAFSDRFAGVGFRESSYVPSYGLAEHVVAATFARRSGSPRVDEVDSGDLTERRVARAASDGRTVAVVSCGVPFPGHEIRILGEDGQALEDRQVGEITLAGPSVMLGYYRDPVQSARTVRNGWLRTGDLGYLANGELFVCGRMKDVIVVHGRKYHPQDLEWAVEQLVGVRRGRVAAFGTVHHDGPERVVLVVEPSGTVSADELTDSIRRRIGDLCGLYVNDVVIVPSGTVGRTTSGKVQRAATKARYERGELAAPEDRAGLHA